MKVWLFLSLQRSNLRQDMPAHPITASPTSPLTAHLQARAAFSRARPPLPRAGSCVVDTTTHAPTPAIALPCPPFTDGFASTPAAIRFRFLFPPRNARAACDR